MEVRDGFIVSIYNYCDSWCERCAFTSHCRVFADVAEAHASMDPNLEVIVGAPPLPEELPPPPPAWLQELLEEANEACRKEMPSEEWERVRPRIPPEHAPIHARAKDYGTRVYEWLKARASLFVERTDDSRRVIEWFHTFIAVKVHRALTVWPDEDRDDRTGPSDSDGSAKVALLGIEQSHAAWLDLVERGVVSAAEAEPFIADLVWLGEALERIRPKARAFVRPAFDEPEEAARLLAAGGTP